MGGSSSTMNATLESNSMVVNENTLNQLNKVVNKVAVDTLIENVKKCSASLVQSQKLTVKHIKCGDNCNIALAQDQKAWLDFSCAQKDEIQMDVVQKMVDTISSKMKESSSADLMNKLNSNISNKSQSDSTGFPWGGSTTNTNVNQKINNYVSNKTTTNIQNVLENAVYSNFKNSNIDECMAKLINEQEITATDIEAGKNFSFTVNQAQKAEAIASCIQGANIASRVVSDLAKYSDLDLTVKKDTTIKNESELKAEAASKQTGILGGIAEIFGGMSGGSFASLGLTGLMPLLAPILSPSVSSSSCSCCIIIIIILFMVLGGGGLALFASKGSGSGSNNAGTGDAGFE